MAITFSGSNYLLTTGSVTALTAVTIAFWATFTSVSNASILGINANYKLIIKSNKLGNVLNATGNGTASATNLTTNTRIHIVATCDRGGTNVHNIYFNGVLDATAAGSNNTASSGTFGIGTRNGLSSGMAGTMEDLRMYNRVLAVSEIETIYACKGSDNIVNGLVGHWLLNELAAGVTVSGTGSVKDLAGSGYNATPTGSPVYADSYLTLRRPL